MKANAFKNLKVKKRFEVRKKLQVKKTVESEKIVNKCQKQKENLELNKKS